MFRKLYDCGEHEEHFVGCGQCRIEKLTSEIRQLRKGGYIGHKLRGTVMDWKAFFTRNESFRVQVRFFGEHESFSLEELYQAFKARYEDERVPRNQ